MSHMNKIKVNPLKYKHGVKRFAPEKVNLYFFEAFVFILDHLIFTNLG